MTRDEAREQLLHLLGRVRREMEGHGWTLELYGQHATLRPIEAGAIETPEPDPHARDEVLAAAMSAATGNLCPECQAPTRPAGACELCPNCGTTSSCG